MVIFLFRPFCFAVRPLSISHCVEINQSTAVLWDWNNSFGLKINITIRFDAYTRHIWYNRLRIFPMSVLYAEPIENPRSFARRIRHVPSKDFVYMTSSNRGNDNASSVFGFYLGERNWKLPPPDVIIFSISLQVTRNDTRSDESATTATIVRTLIKPFKTTHNIKSLSIVVSEVRLL